MNVMMNVTMDRGSALWVSEDLKIIIEETLTGNARFYLGFPRMNEVDVEEVVISTSDGANVEDGAFPLPLGIYGRGAHFKIIGSSVLIPAFGVRITLKASEAGRKRATFNLEIAPSASMEPIT